MPNKTEKNPTVSTNPTIEDRVAFQKQQIFNELENFFQQGYLSQPFDALDFATIALLADKNYDYDLRAAAIIEYSRINRLLATIFEKLSILNQITTNGGNTAKNQEVQL